MAEFKYLGEKAKNFVNKYVEKYLQYDAKFELNELLKDMSERTKELEVLKNGC